MKRSMLNSSNSESYIQSKKYFKVYGIATLYLNTTDSLLNPCSSSFPEVLNKKSFLYTVQSTMN